MAFWNKDPGFGVESVETIAEILKTDRHELFEDLGVEPLEADELDTLIQAKQLGREWTCLFVFNLKAKLLAMKPEQRKQQPLELELEMALKPFKWNLPSLGWFRMLGGPIKNPYVETDEERRVRVLREEEEHRLYREQRAREVEERERREAAEAISVREAARLAGFNSLTVKEQTKIGAGSYGSYIKLSDQYGVKVLRDYCRSSMDRVPLAHERVLREFQDQRKAREMCGSLVPEVVAIVPVEMDGNWYPGLVMEHVEGQPLAIWASSNGWDYGKTSTIMNKLTEFMNKSGVMKSDHHEYNVLVDNKGEYRVIDFGLGCHFGKPQPIEQHNTLQKAG